MYKSSARTLLANITNDKNVQFTTKQTRVSLFKSAYGSNITQLVKDELISNDNLHEKSTTVSNRYREAGNDLYKQRIFSKALKSYTLAVCFAPHNSTAHALALSNRSACNYELHSYETSLTDISCFESLTAPVPPAVTTRVSERKAKCVNNMTPKQPLQNYFTLHSENPQVPSACAQVGISHSSIRGRHLTNISNDTIQPGSLIIMEDPYASVCLDQYKFTYLTCSLCYKQLRGGGIPCHGCVFSLYCTDTCRESDRLHPLECPISKYLHELNLDRNVYLSVKILLTALHDKTPLTPAPTCSSRSYNGRTYSSIHSLIYHESNLSNHELFTLLKVCTAINMILNPPQDHTATLLHHSLTLPCNAHAMYSLPTTYTPESILNTTLQEFGAGAFGLLSMLNHSCDPNVTRVTLPHGTTCVISIKPIPPNSEILDNYGVHYATHSLPTRQSHTKSSYNFPCDCPACTHTYPLITSIPDTALCDCRTCDFQTKLEDFISLHTTSITSLESNNPVQCVSEAISCLQFFSHFKHPYKYFNFSQETLKQALFVLASYQF